MKTINDIEIREEHFRNEKYNFQPKLTLKLDAISSDFNQEVINQIVLWKVNRYVEIDDGTLALLNKIKKDAVLFDEDLTREVLRKLLSTKGIQLPMASTILKFKNPNVYQIIDQRVYRFIYGKNLPNYFSSIDSQIDLYLGYLQKLHDACIEKDIEFKFSDRIIYELDKEYNKEVKIRH